MTQYLRNITQSFGTNLGGTHHRAFTLQGLLELNFDEFVRVGSMKKIAKPILPYSVHAVGSASTELRELQDMMRSEVQKIA